MPQRMTLLTATAITAFVLVLLGGLLTRLSLSTTNPQTAPISDAPAPLPAEVAAREAAYQEQIRLANERIAQANALLVQATTQAQKNAPAAAPAAPAAPVAVSPAAAAAIASRLAPGARLLRDPELVSYDGTPAYAVAFDLGTVYIDAASGSLLASDIAEISIAQGPDAIWGEHAEYGEHEGDEHERDEHAEGYHD